MDGIYRWFLLDLLAGLDFHRHVREDSVGAAAAVDPPVRGRRGGRCGRRCEICLGSGGPYADGSLSFVQQVRFIVVGLVVGGGVEGVRERPIGVGDQAVVFGGGVGRGEGRSSGAEGGRR